MRFIALLLIVLLQFVLVPHSRVAYAATSPTLGDADSFSVLAKTLISDADVAGDLTSISGDVGLDDTGAAITGLTTAEVAGTIYATDGTGPDGVTGNNPALMTSARNANIAAYGTLNTGDNSTCTTIDVELGGQTLVPGVYCSGGVFTLNGTLTLSGTTGTWIFQSTATLITGGTANVVGGDPCNVWWQVPSSATLGTNTSLTGNVLALTSITIQTGASLDGRAFAQNGAVTLDDNTISGPTCAAAATPTPTPTPTRV